MSRQYQKEIERPSGRGQLFDGAQHVADVSYRLLVTQTVHVSRMLDSSTQETEGLRSISGRIDVPDTYTLLGRELVLHMADGRALNVLLRNDRGDVLGNGDFFTP